MVINHQAESWLDRIERERAWRARRNKRKLHSLYGTAALVIAFAIPIAAILLFT